MTHASTARNSVLFIDDDLEMQREVSAYLGANGFDVETAANGVEMDAHLARKPYPLVILDLMLPGEDGLSICRRLDRRRAQSIVVLSAAATDIDRIIGLEVGADDYLAKPCNPRELLARARAVLRRAGAPPIDAEPGLDAPARGAPMDRPEYSFDGYQLDVLRRRLVSPDGVISLLTTTELSLLVTMLEKPGVILSRDALLEHSRDDETEALDRTIDVQISRIRRKIPGQGGQELIRTYRGAGYMLDARVVRR
jgi:two-component system OmpR family response regulator